MTKSKRSRKQSRKATENEIALRKNNIASCIRKFNKLTKKGPACTNEIKDKITDIYLDVTAELDILCKLEPEFTEDEQVREQVALMEKYVKTESGKFPRASHSVHSHSQSKVSKSSIAIEVARIQTEEVEAEIQALRVQAENERVLNELEQKLKDQKLKMQQQSLVDKRNRLSLRRRLLEENGVDEREEIVQALDNTPYVGASNEIAQPSAEENVVENDQQSLVVSVKSNVSEAQILADSIAKAVHSSKFPVPEPPIFSGNPLEYVNWEVSFRSLVERSGIPDSDKIHYLKQYLAGPAKEAVSGLFYLQSSDAYEKARKKLKERFGSDCAVAEAFRSKLEQWPKIKGNDNAHIQKFADFLSQCETVMSHLEGLKILNDSRYNMALAAKLPDWLANRWKRKIVEHKKSAGKFPAFSMFVEFVNNESDILNDPSIVSYSTSSDDTKQPKKPTKSKSTAHLATSNSNSGDRNSDSNSNSKAKPSCAFCHLSNHDLAECRKLARKTAEEKKQFVLEQKLCFSCLKATDHRSAQCTSKATCKACGKNHPTALHVERVPKTENQKNDNAASPTKTKDHMATTTGASTPNPPAKAANNESKALATCSDSQANSSNSLSSMIVPVWLSSTNQPSKEILVYAMLDTMSDTTFVTNNAVRWLNTVGKPTTLQLTTMTASSKNIECKMYTDLVIRGYSAHDSIQVPCAYTRDSIPLDKSHIPSAQMTKDWPHLQAIAHEIPNLQGEKVEVGMLIGYNMSRALVPLKSIIGASHADPYAVQTPLGWSIVGKLQKGSKEEFNHTSHRIMTLQNQNHAELEPKAVTFVCKAEATDELCSKQIIDLLQQDFTEKQSPELKQIPMSQEDKRFVSTLSEQAEQTQQGFYSMPLPFKTRPVMPNNLAMAKKRFSLLQKKMEKDEQYRNDYIAFMAAIIEAGDAELVPTNSKATPGEVWYIPHFGVYHPKKPDKIRVVFDCSAKYQATCLNEHLLQGPDLLNSLVGILHRFRKGQIAIMCDIQRMFHMFRVHESDRDFLRFLWYKDDTMSQIAEYRMAVHLFGATSSPGCATFGLRKLVADKHDPEQPYSVQAKHFITHDFYVDDGLMSLDSQEQAIGVINNAIELCSKGNVRLHKFVCNNREVMTAVPETEKAANFQDLDLQAANSALPIERALGIQWCVENDQFQFKIALKSQPVTRRGILSTIASVFDPLGLISPFILKGKQILQEMCKENLEWDDPLPEHLQNQWQCWMHDLVALAQIKIDRCLKPSDFENIISTELHHFSDASNLGYGQCSYIRYVNADNRVHCTLLCGKSRVAPLKQVTIPRAELQAAVLSATIAHNLKSELKLNNLTKEVFWTDSKVVLGYIHNEARRFHVYVANRVQQITDITLADQWQYISTQENPADIASRGANIKSLVDSCWLTGPKFLRNSNLQLFPVAKEYTTLNPTDPEIKATCHSLTSSKKLTMTDRLTAYSSLQSAVRAVSKLQSFVRSKTGAHSIISKVEAHEKAKLTILKWAQQGGLTEYEQIKQGTLSKSSALAKLDPFIDSSGIIRVGGRLKEANLPFAETHPIVLPKKSHVTQLVIANCHRAVAHQGKGITLNEIRSSGYWILGGSSLVASYIHSCIQCRKQRRPTESQKMADLPSERVNSAPPFTYVGCDCFGPFIVKENRKELKRYGVIFTCMASRAIHVEVLDDMSTDAFINALRCFIAIRGPIRQLHTDRGTNFIGAANEFAKTFKEGSHNKFTKFAQSNHFDFVTNPPHSSHMGGAWERHIRTIRSVLNSILMNSHNRLDTGTLRTFLYEAMAITNCRPLTAVSDNSSVETALSPNQLLTMKSQVVMPPPGEFDSEDTYSRKRWRVVQGLANTFWSRWRKEYLQTLQKRQKWTKVCPNIEKDDIVILQDDSKHRNHWPLARVMETIPSKDKLVRKVKLLLADGRIDNKGRRLSSQVFLERPINKVILLCKPHANI
ncbi:uncharacterized protein [Watersipora subatra]|uniref:uncharacterized protein n=1 Tax=Watersipora subatra TaxID=2589382 RepID=UPI00355B38EF